MDSNYDLEGFEFLGFRPGYEVVCVANSVLDELKSLSPSDSASQAKLVKTAMGFEAILKFASASGTFIARAKSGNPFRAISSISRQIRMQLDQWRQKRFGRSP